MYFSSDIMGGVCDNVEKSVGGIALFMNADAGGKERETERERKKEKERKRDREREKERKREKKRKKERKRYGNLKT